MHILIETAGETKHMEVADLAEAQALADAGNTVLVPNSDGGHRQLEAAAGHSIVYQGVPVHFEKYRAPPEFRAEPAAPKAPAAKKVAAKVPAKKTAAKRK